MDKPSSTQKTRDLDNLLQRRDETHAKKRTVFVARGEKPAESVGDPTATGRNTSEFRTIASPTVTSINWTLTLGILRELKFMEILEVGQVVPRPHGKNVWRAEEANGMRSRCVVKQFQGHHRWILLRMHSTRRGHAYTADSSGATSTHHHDDVLQRGVHGPASAGWAWKLRRSHCVGCVKQLCAVVSFCAVSRPDLGFDVC